MDTAGLVEPRPTGFDAGWLNGTESRLGFRAVSQSADLDIAI